MRYILASIMFFSVMPVRLWGGEENKSQEVVAKLVEEDSVLKSNVHRIESRMAKEDEKLQEAIEDHKKAMEKHKKDLISAYEAAMKKYTRKGDLRTATALMEVVDKLKKEDPAAVEEPRRTAGTIVVEFEKTPKDCAARKIAKGTVPWTNRSYTINKYSGELEGFYLIALPCKTSLGYKIKPGSDCTVYALTPEAHLPKLEGWSKSDLSIEASTGGFIVVTRKLEGGKTYEIPSLNNTPLLITKGRIEIKESAKEK